ncbi:MAG: 2-amino-4-hydroxy-6-hydroxymethyldihydropteridine diphosphokinase [Pseudomonadota bacterium]|nr:2-amino-4-hydroxy-6-hydroxymethyldihydropteridine diphosphokinase [Pseudomonadota bacterium]
MTSHVFLALGSNLSDPVAQIQQAIQALASSVDAIECAPLYQSKPLGPQNQPDFVNTVISGYTDLNPDALLTAVQGIEQQQRRVKTQHWGPRTIDIDILFYDDLRLNTPQLTIPHKELLNRSFVTIPLFDLIPNGITPTGDQIDRNRYDSSKLVRIDTWEVRSATDHPEYPKKTSR